jgi:hypothetical protein
MYLFILLKVWKVWKVCCLLFLVCCLERLWFKNGYVREQGKTRGAIGFALIFLCFVSFYQDKEMKKKDNYFISAV